MAASSSASSLIDVNVASFMTKNVKTIETSKSLSDCVKLMKDHNIGSVVVVENGNPVGIFTERDLIRIIAGAKESMKSKMDEVMSKPLRTIPSTATLWDAVSLMGRFEIRRLPVVDDGKLVGIFTEKDLFRLILSQQNLVLESVAEYLPAMTREQLKSLVIEFGSTEKPPSRT